MIREQMLAVGARLGLAPVLDVARDPRWGRVEETYGEDPVLAGALGTAYVRGLQTSDLRPVDRGSMEAGIILCRWFANEARRVYMLLAESAEQCATRRLVEFIRAD